MAPPPCCWPPRTGRRRSEPAGQGVSSRTARPGRWISPAGNEGLLMAPAYAVSAMLRDAESRRCRISTSTKSTRRSRRRCCARSRPGSPPTTAASGWVAARRSAASTAASSTSAAAASRSAIRLRATGARILAVAAKLFEELPACKARADLRVHGRRHGRHGHRRAAVSRMGEFNQLMARDGQSLLPGWRPRPARRAARWWCCRRSSASTRTSAR